MHHPCHGCFQALHALAYTSLVRGSPDDQNAGMLHMEAAGPVGGRGRQRNGETQAKWPWSALLPSAPPLPEIKAPSDFGYRLNLSLDYVVKPCYNTSSLAH